MHRSTLLLSAFLLAACSSDDDSTPAVPIAPANDAGRSVIDSGTPATTPDAGSVMTTPNPSLAAKIGAAMQGTYILMCPTDPHTIVINADGSSMLDGVAVSDTTHIGNIQVPGGGPGNVGADSTDPAHAGFPGFLLQFDATGKATTSSLVKTDSASPRLCASVSGTADLTRFKADQIIASYQATVNVKCTGIGAPKAIVAHVITADGIVKVGDVIVQPTQYLATNAYALSDTAAFKDKGNAETVTVGTGKVKIASVFTVEKKLTKVTVQNGIVTYSCTP